MRITATAAAVGDAEGDGVAAGVDDGDGALDGAPDRLADGAVVAPGDPDGLADGRAPQAPMSMANSTTTSEVDFFMRA